VAADDYTIKVKLALEDFERKLVASIKKVQPIVKEAFLGVLDIFAPELSILIEGIKNEVDRIRKMIKGGEREGETFLERMTERLTGGVAAGAVGAAGAGGAAAPAALAVVAIQSMISIIKQVLDYLKKVSAVLGAVFKLIETSIMLLIKPIADFIGYILKPIVMLFLRFFVIPFYRAVMPMIKEMGDLWDKMFTQIMQPLMPLLKQAAEILGKVLPYILPALIPVILGIVSVIAAPILMIVSAVLVIKYLIDLIWRGLQALWNAIQGFIKWLQNGWNWVVNNILKPIFNILKSLADALLGVGKALDPRNWGKGLGEAFKPVADFFKTLFGWQWGGVVQRTGFYRLHAGEVVLPPGEVAQTVFVYPRIEIGAVYLGSERDLSRLEERINKAIADALRRRRV
jgi:phage-related protein